MLRDGAHRNNETSPNVLPRDVFRDQHAGDQAHFAHPAATELLVVEFVFAREQKPAVVLLGRQECVVRCLYVTACVGGRFSSIFSSGNRSRSAFGSGGRFSSAFTLSVILSVILHAIFVLCPVLCAVFIFYAVLCTVFIFYACAVACGSGVLRIKFPNVLSETTLACHELSLVL